MLDQSIIQQLAQDLLTAEDTKVPTPALTERYPEITVDDAYAVQGQVLAMKLARGEHVIGKKIGLTSLGMQRQMNINTPDFGIMTNKGVVADGENIDVSEMIAPRIEAELVFLLKKDLDGPQITTWDVIDATAGVMPALEIVDSRIKDWKIKLPDTVADAASYARVVTGGNRLVPINNVDLSMVPMACYRNGELIDTGCGAAIMGNPINAVVWLANTMVAQGTPMKAGELILSGAFAAAFDFRAGDSVVANFGPLGSVSLLGH